MNVWFRITKSAGESFQKLVREKNLPVAVYTPKKENVAKFEKIKNKENLFCFSIIRNPYFKVISAYIFLTQGSGKSRLKHFEFLTRTSFLDFLKYYLEYREKYKEYSHYCHQSGVLYLEVEPTLNTLPYSYFWWMQHMEGTYNTINTFISPEKIDLYVKLENYSEEIKPLEERLNTSLNLPHINKSSHLSKGYLMYYNNSKVLDIVESIYKKDIEFFGYKLN